MQQGDSFIGSIKEEKKSNCVGSSILCSMKLETFTTINEVLLVTIIKPPMILSRCTILVKEKKTCVVFACEVATMEVICSMLICNELASDVFLFCSILRKCV